MDEQSATNIPNEQTQPHRNIPSEVADHGRCILSHEQRITMLEGAVQELDDHVGAAKAQFTEDQVKAVLAMMDKYFPQGA